MRVAEPITLTIPERNKLEKIVKSRSASARLIERSRMVLLASQGLNNIEIGEQLGTDPVKVGRWRKRFPRFKMHFTPTSSSWLNMVERFFRDLTMQSVRRGVFRSVSELIAAIEEHIAAHNANPKPFIWTAKASDILEKVTRARSKLQNVQSA